MTNENESSQVIFRQEDVAYTPFHLDAETQNYIIERPVETVVRRLSELELDAEDMNHATHPSDTIEVGRLKDILAEKVSPTLGELYVMLDYVGMDLVAVTRQSPYEKNMRSANGHWFSGERCQYCGVNMYDADNDIQCSKEHGKY